MEEAAPKKSPTAAKRARPTPTTPNMYMMLLDALTNLNDRKGASLPAIKNYIVEKYPAADNAMLRSRLKKAVAKGMDKGVITRPKSAEAAGASMTGRFRLDKAALAKDTKPAADKPKKAEKSVDKKKSPKSSKVKDKGEKTKKAAKSPKTKKSPKAAKKSPKAAAAKVKKPKSPSAKKTVAKTKKVADKPKKPKAKTTKSPNKKVARKAS